MKKLVSALMGLMLSTSALSAAEGGPLWLRHQQISPDGSQIAFCYGGDIFTVPITGGKATQITSNPAYDGYPIWSPNGKQIAFSSDREGSPDIYVVSAQGGAPTRLTFNSGNEQPNAFLNDSTILYNAYVMPTKEFGMFPSSLFTQVYAVSTKGTRPSLVSSYPMQMISVRPDGTFLYTDVKGYEDPFRKHEQASVCRDIWMRSNDGKSFSKLTNFKGEDRNAVWTPNGKGFYYLSEKDGTSNVYYRADATNPNADKQLTHFKKNPVRFLSVAANGTLSFGYDGELYILQPGAQEPQKIAISLVADNKPNEVDYMTLKNGCQSFALSPNEKEVAFVVRGDVYVANVEFGTTKRITNTPEQERNVSFSPDGRSVMYASERNGIWNIYATKLQNSADKLFCYAKDLKEEPLTTSKDLPCFQAKYSPDGKMIAFLRNRTEIVGKDLKSGKEWVIMPGKYQYSYQDGDQEYAWSPDSKWILTNFIGIGGWNNTDVAVFAADGSGKYTDLTESGYNEGIGRWVFGGKAILFTSDRKGLRNHGSWGSSSDYYIMFLDREAYEKFCRTKEERQIADDAKEEADKAPTDKTAEKKKGKKDKKKTDEDKVKPLQLDFENRDMRTIRLTMAPGFLGDAVLDGEGTSLYYVATYGTTSGLWKIDLDEFETKLIAEDVEGQLVLAKDGKTIYCADGSGIRKIDPSGAPKRIDFSAQFEHRPQAERAYIFEHVWKQVKDKFYDPKLHGVDWEYYKKVYAKFLPYINNDTDFAELLSEMLGELNASHTGARYRASYTAPATAALGAFFDPNHPGDGLLVQEVLAGGPLDRADSLFKAGVLITAIDGEPIKAGTPLENYLNGKVGKRILITYQTNGAKSEKSVIIKPISQGIQSELLYRRWLKQREDLVNKWSKGKVAYVYVRAMNSPSFRNVFQDLLGKYRNCDAAIVDTRNNGGGWLHDDLVILLGGKHSIRFTPRGQYIGSDPFMQWCKPSCVLQSEGNYSNGHGFPWLYKYLKMGKLIGAPVPGTMTAVWWENQLNPRLVFGIPQVTCQDMEGNVLENQELESDILIYNTPEDYLSGHDAQLKRAVDEMLQTIEKSKSK